MTTYRNFKKPKENESAYTKKNNKDILKGNLIKSGI